MSLLSFYIRLEIRFKIIIMQAFSAANILGFGHPTTNINFILLFVNYYIHVILHSWWINLNWIELNCFVRFSFIFSFSSAFRPGSP